MQNSFTFRFVLFYFIFYFLYLRERQREAEGEGGLLKRPVVLLRTSPAVCVGRRLELGAWALSTDV